MKKINVERVVAIISSVTIVLFIAIQILGTSEDVVFYNNKVVERYASNNGNYTLTSSDIISKATQALGIKYKLGGKGADAYSTGKLYDFNTTKNIGLDCSGLVYWTLNSLVKEKNIAKGTEGFAMNTPVPVDTYNWLQNKNWKYWSETGLNKNNYASNAGLKFNGQNINILKANECLANTSWYKYGNDQYLPAGTVVVSYNSWSSNTYGRRYYNHAWLALGNLGNVSEKELAKILVNKYGVDPKYLIADGGDINGNFEIRKAYTYNKGYIPVIQKTTNSSYWRIECGGSNNMVWINNDDPTTNPYNSSKNHNYIWAFQLANDEIKGEYNLEIEADDYRYNAVNARNEDYKNLYSVKFNNKELSTSSIENDMAYYNGFEINENNVNNKDYITIQELKNLPGYEKYENKIELEISKASTSKGYAGYVSNAKVIDKDGNVVKSYSNSRVSYGFQVDDVLIVCSGSTINIRIRHQYGKNNYVIEVEKLKGEDKTPEQGVEFQSVKCESCFYWDMNPNMKTTTATTNVRGKVCMGEEEVGEENLRTFDKYVITEIAKNGDKVEDGVWFSVYVGKKYSEKSDSYIGDGWIVVPENESFITSEQSIVNGYGNITIKKNGKTYEISTTQDIRDKIKVIVWEK